MCHHIWLLHRSRGLNSAPQAYAASMLLTELSPQFQNGFSNKGVWCEMPGGHTGPQTERWAPAHRLYRQSEGGSATTQNIYEQGCSESPKSAKVALFKCQPIKAFGSHLSFIVKVKNKVPGLIILHQGSSVSSVCRPCSQTTDFSQLLSGARNRSLTNHSAERPPLRRGN